MVTLVMLTKDHKRFIQHYIKKLTIRLPTLFEFGSAAVEAKAKKRARKKAIASTKVVRVKKPKVYYLYGDGSFGGLVLHGYMILKNKEALFEEIQAANLHASDVFMPEQVKMFERVVRSKRFKQQGVEDKTELSSNA